MLKQTKYDWKNGRGLFMSEENTKENEYTEIDQIFTRNFNKINNLIENEFLDEAVILMVTILEVFWKDLFKNNKELWFVHLTEGGMICALPNAERVEHRRFIRKYLESIRVYDDFLRNYYVYQSQIPDPDIDSVYEALFNNKNDKINFQNLKGDNGAKQAYKTFFGIKLNKLFDKDENQSESKWRILNGLFDQRHEIIHAGRNTSLSKDELNELLRSIQIMKINLLNKIYVHWGIQFSSE